METKFSKRLWFLALNGVIALLLGLLLLLFTQETIRSIVFFFGLFLLVTGLAVLLYSLYIMKKEKISVLTIVQSIFSIALGICLMVAPTASLKLFLVLFGVWVVVAGVFVLLLLINLKHSFDGKTLTLFIGLLTIVLGGFLIFYPLEFGQVVVKILGVFSFLFGIIMISMAVVISRALKRPENPS